MEDAYRKRVVKLAPQRQTINVSLDDVRVWQTTRGGKRRLHGLAQIDSDNFTRAPLRGELRVTSLATTAFEHNFVAEKLRRDWRDPTKELLRILLIFLGEVPPLPTEVLSGRLLV